MPGGNLGDILFDLEISISSLLKLCWCIDISKGIAYIHNMFSKAKLVHGDIKPENILLTKDLRCKIGDFGGSILAATSTSVMSVAASTQPSKEEHITALYAAPEVLKKPLISLKHTHDVFSFGMVVYVILTRVQPSQNLILTDFREPIIHGQLPGLGPIESKERDLLAGGNKSDFIIINILKRTMVQCLSQDPSFRPDMSKVLRLLCNVLSKLETKTREKAVRDVLAKYKMYHPSFDESETVSIDQVVWLDASRGIVALINCAFSSCSIVLFFFIGFKKIFSRSSR